MKDPIIFTVPDDNGEDSGKQFEISRMPALKAHDWAVRGLLALSRAGVEMPENIQNIGLAGIAMFGFRSLGKVQFEEAQGLLGQLRACARYIPDPVAHPEIKRAINDQTNDIEEFATYFLIEKEVFDFHTGFFTRAARLRSELAALTATRNSSSTPTSPAS